MEIFNVGPLELLFIILLAFVVLGPQGSVKAARQAGAWVYRVVHSPFWASMMKTSQEIRDIPRQIVREAGIEESLREIRQQQAQMKVDLDRGLWPANDHPVGTEQDDAQTEAAQREAQDHAVSADIDPPDSMA